MQSEMAAGGGLLQRLGITQGDTRIFENNAEGERALLATRGIVGSTLDRGGLAKALEQGRSIDLSGADLSEFFGEDFAQSLS